MITALLVTLASFHTAENPYRTVNPFNPGIGLRWADVQTGVYLNSQRMMSAYVSTEVEWRRDARVGLGVGAGAVTGYRDHAVLPFLYAFVRVGPARVLVLPLRSPVVAVQLEVRRRIQ